MAVPSDEGSNTHGITAVHEYASTYRGQEKHGGGSKSEGFKKPQVLEECEWEGYDEENGRRHEEVRRLEGEEAQSEWSNGV